MHWITHFRYPIYFLQINELRRVGDATCGDEGMRVPVAHLTPEQTTLCSQADSWTSPYCSRPVCLVSSGEDQLHQYGIDSSDSELITCGLAMLAFYVGYRFLAYLALKYVNHLKR